MTQPRKPKSRRRSKTYVNPARMIITLENYGGIKKQSWSGAFSELSVNWPDKPLCPFGPYPSPYPAQPSVVEIQARLFADGADYKISNR